MIPYSMVSDSMASILQCASNIAELLNTVPGYLLKLQHVPTKPQQAGVADNGQVLPTKCFSKGVWCPLTVALIIFLQIRIPLCFKSLPQALRYVWFIFIISSEWEA